MEIVTKVMEKSWKSHGNLLVKMCTNPDCCKVKHFISCFVLILNIRAYSSLRSKKQYLKILEYFLRSIKKKICKTEKFKFFKVC